MKKHVTFTLQEEAKNLIKFKQLLELVVDNKIYKSSIIEECLWKGFVFIDKEIAELGEKFYENMPKKLHNTDKYTFYLSRDVLEQLNFYSKQLGLKKSHIVQFCILKELR